MFNLKRPKPTDTEEDLVAEEEQFRVSLDQDKNGQRSSFKPAAQVVKVKRDSEVIPEPCGTADKISSQSTKGGTVEKTVDLSDFIGGIREKNVNALKSRPDVLNNFEWMKQTVPQKPGTSNAPKKRISVFKQERMKQQQLPENIEKPVFNPEVLEKVQANYEFNPLKLNKDLERRAVVAAGGFTDEDEAVTFKTSASSSAENDSEVGSKIHPLLAGYSEANVLEAQRELLKMMKPETKEFLLSRKLKATTQSVSSVDAAGPSVNSIQTEKPEIDWEDLPIHPDSVKSIPHMDQVEEEKLEWMLPMRNTQKVDVDKTDTNKNSTATRSARFNFRGEVVTEEMEKDEDTWNHALHNHGEEMERPGYTIEELFTMARSTFAQQRAMGFNTLARIFDNSHTGEVGLSLDRSLFHVCTEMDFIHVLRVGMDNSDAQSTNAAINCLASLLYPSQEEYYLDCCYLWPDAEPYPSISVMLRDQGSSENSVRGNPEEDVPEAELKDYQHVRTDLIEFLISRTDILVRFNFLLRSTEAFLNETGILGILKILIRVARHSPNKLMEFDELMKRVATNFMSSNFTTIGKRNADMVGIPLPLAVKLFRVLVSSSEENARKMYTQIKLFPSVMSYLAYDQWLDQNHVMEVEYLILESFKLWDAFLIHGLGVEEYSSFFPVLMNFLHLLRTRDTLCSFDLDHSAHLFALMEKLIRGSHPSHSHWSLVKHGASFVAAFVVRLLAILSRRNTAELYDHDSSLAAISKGLQFLTLAQKYERFPDVDSAVWNFVEGSGYSEITACLLTHSLLLSKLGDITKELDKYPSNMSPCTSILYGGHLTPIMTKGTPFSFLTALLRFLNANSEKLSEKLKILIVDSNVEKYLKRISSSDIRLRNNVFLRFELQCISEFLNFVSPTEQAVVSYSVLPHIQNGDQKLAEVFLAIFHKSSGFSSYMETFQLYSHLLITKPQSEQSVKFQDLNMKLLPYDWIIEPLNHLHRRSLFLEKQKLDKEKRVHVLNSIKECTEITLKFLEYCLNKHASVLVKTVTHIAAIYSRLVLVFMMGNEIFFEKPIQALLRNLAKLLLSNPVLKNANGQVFTNFNKMPGFSPDFSTFYGELLDEFSQNSFGDDVFGVFMMMPLRTGDDREVKSRFWNDESVRYIRLNLENAIIPLDYFTQLQESDPSIIQIYRNTLNSSRVLPDRNPLLYNILKFHVTHKS